MTPVARKETAISIPVSMVRSLSNGMPRFPVKIYMITHSPPKKAFAMRRGIFIFPTLYGKDLMARAQQAQTQNS